VHEVPISSIKKSRYQIREFIDEKELEAITQSILSKGIIQPILIRELQNDLSHNYELIAGERRLEAAKRAGLSFIPAILRSVGDRETLELAIIENSQRLDLNPIEEALSYMRLVSEFGANQTEISQAVGKNRATISNLLRLLQLEPEVIELIKTKELSAGHGRALLMVKEPNIQLVLAKKVVSEGLSVRALESIILKLNSKVDEEEDTEGEITKRASLERLEDKLKNLLDIESVSLRLNPQGKKKLHITFDTEAAWKRFMSRIRQ
jgi:ParB family transcriptional regulator, chromosome partitioning protein